MRESDRVQRWRQKMKASGHVAVTLWLTTEEKERLEALAQTRHCSPSALVRHALSLVENPPPLGSAAVTDTTQLRALIREELTELMTATGPLCPATDSHAPETPGFLPPVPLRLASALPHATGQTAQATPATKAAVVARLRALRAQGFSLAQIAAQLREEGVPTLSGRGSWQKGTIGSLLQGG